MENKGCLVLIIIVLVIVGLVWFPWLLIVVGMFLVGLIIVRIVNASIERNKLEEVKRFQEEEMRRKEEERKKCVFELLSFARDQDYSRFQALLKHSFTILSIDEIVKVQESYIQVMESGKLKPMSCMDIVVAGNPCYYENSVEVAQQRQRQGNKYVDYENAIPATMYITGRTIELVSTQHRSVNIMDVLQILVGTEQKTISLTLRKCGSPLLIVCPDGLIVEYIIKRLQTLQLQKQGE